VVLPGLSYAQVLAFRRARAADSETSDATEFDVDISHHITSPPRHHGSAYRILPFYAAVKKPARAAGATYANLVLDPTDRFHAELGAHINRSFPTAVGKESWKNGLSLALDPCHLDADTLARIYPTAFILHFVCPVDSVDPNAVVASAT
jgi:hypothetical protein